MIYTIAVCDDDEVQVYVIQEYINNLIGEHEINLIKAYSGEELLAKVKDKYVDAFFLDIEMNGVNGINLGEKLRERYKHAVIVYITGFTNYALNAFEVRAFNYIMKPLTFSRFKVIFHEIIDRLDEINHKKQGEKEFIAECKGFTCRIKYKDIYYFEKYLRKIRIVSEGKDFEVYGTFKNLKNNIDMSYFTQCHQSFIVNNDKINSYKNYDVYIKQINAHIPVSKAYVRTVKEILAKQLFY